MGGEIHNQRDREHSSLFSFDQRNPEIQKRDSKIEIQRSSNVKIQRWEKSKKVKITMLQELLLFLRPELGAREIS